MILLLELLTALFIFFTITALIEHYATQGDRSDNSKSE